MLKNAGGNTQVTHSYSCIYIYIYIYIYSRLTWMLICLLTAKEFLFLFFALSRPSKTVGTAPGFSLSRLGSGNPSDLKNAGL